MRTIRRASGVRWGPRRTRTARHASGPPATLSTRVSSRPHRDSDHKGRLRPARRAAAAPRRCGKEEAMRTAALRLRARGRESDVWRYLKFAKLAGRIQCARGAFVIIVAMTGPMLFASAAQAVDCVPGWVHPLVNSKPDLKTGQ